MIQDENIITKYSIFLKTIKIYKKSMEVHNKIICK